MTPSLYIIKELEHRVCFNAYWIIDKIFDEFLIHTSNSSKHYHLMITETLSFNPNEKHQEEIHTNNVSILLTSKIINWRQRLMLKISSAHVQQPFALRKNFYSLLRYRRKFQVWHVLMNDDINAKHCWWHVRSNGRCPLQLAIFCTHAHPTRTKAHVRVPNCL